MKMQIKRVGNSAGVLIPAVMLKEVNLEVGREIDLSIRDGGFWIQPLKQQKRGSRELDLDWLLADFKDLENDLITSPNVGAEILSNETYQDYPDCPGNTKTR